MNIFIAPYFLDVRPVRSKKDENRSNCFKVGDNIAGMSLLLHLSNFFEAISHGRARSIVDTSNLNEKDKESFSLDLKEYTYKDSTHRGVFYAGQSGITSTIRHRVTKKVRLDRNAEDEETFPLYFQLMHDVELNRNILLLQKYGTHSAYDPFKKAISAYFFNVDINVRIDLSPIATKDSIDDFLKQGPVMKVTMRSNMVSADDAIKFDSSFDRKKDAYTEFTIKARRNKFLALRKSIMEYVNGTRNNLFSVQGLEVNDVFITSKINNQTKTISLGGSKDFRPSFLCENLKFENGHPTYESINNEANDIMSGVKAIKNG